MFGFDKRNSKYSAALVPQQQERNQPQGPEPTSLQLFDRKDQRNFSVLESVNGDGLVLIGKGTSVSGQIGNCSKVEIQGHLEGTIVATRVAVREGGSIRGGLHAEHAEVQGVVDGEVLVEELLDVRATGQVMGEVGYGKLAVEVGGNISGTVRVPDQAPRAAEPKQERDNGYAPQSSPEAPTYDRLNGKAPPADRY